MEVKKTFTNEEHSALWEQIEQSEIDPILYCVVASEMTRTKTDEEGNLLHRIVQEIRPAKDDFEVILKYE